MQTREGLPLGWLLLYAVTVALEAPVIMMRYTVMLFLGALTLRVTGHPGSASGWAELAVIPTLWSLAALVTPIGGGWWWQQQLGGRRPSAREQQAYEEAIGHLKVRSQTPLPAPRRWFVMDVAQADAAVCGDTMMLSRGLLESPHLPAVLAHELGHLQGIDGRLTAAVNRLVIHPLPRPNTSPQQDQTQRPAPPVLYNPRVQNTILTWRFARWLAHRMMALLRGGLGLHMTAPAWGKAWREQEYEADRYAASIGQAEGLADFLEVEALDHDHPIPLVWLTEHTHPPTELRIEKLRAAKHMQTQAVQA